MYAFLVYYLSTTPITTKSWESPIKITLQVCAKHGKIKRIIINEIHITNGVLWIVSYQKNSGSDLTAQVFGLCKTVDPFFSTSLFRSWSVLQATF